MLLIDDLMALVYESVCCISMFAGATLGSGPSSLPSVVPLSAVS